MIDMPVQRSAGTPGDVEDPAVAADSVVKDPAKAETPEGLAAKQRLARGKSEAGDTAFTDLEKEMQGLKGMSEL